MQYFKLSVVLPVLATIAQADTGIPDAWHTAVANGVSQLQAAQLFVGAGTGYLQKGSTAVWNFGVTDLASGRATDDRSIYEIGSVSKSFVGIMLAEQIGEGKAALLGTVDQYLPQFHGTFVGGITLQQLATHTSGLPRMPCEDPSISYCFHPKNPADPYADYTWTQLEGFLAQYAPAGYDATKPRPAYPRSYSNVGFGLLGYLLQVTDQAPSFDAMLAKRVTGPLGMVDTSVSLSPEQQTRLVSGYDTTLTELAHWTFDVMAPTGGIHSTPVDMLKYLSANLDPDASALGTAITLSHAEGLGWDSQPGATVTWKNGQTGGFSTWIVFNKSLELGYFVLSNLGDSPDSGTLGNLPFPGTPPFTDLTSFAVPSAELDAYAGSYSCATTGLAFQVSRRGGDLIYLQEGGRALLRATSATDFGLIDGLYPAGWNSLSFDGDSAGEVVGVTFHTKDDTGQAQPDIYCLRDGVTGRANSSEVAGAVAVPAGAAGFTAARSRSSLDPAFGAL